MVELSTPKRSGAERLRRASRVANALFWFGMWIAVVVWTGTFRHWIPMIAESFIPIMLWMFIHIALRPHGPNDGPED
jgi:hypothetical protein